MSHLSALPSTGPSCAPARSATLTVIAVDGRPVESTRGRQAFRRGLLVAALVLGLSLIALPHSLLWRLTLALIAAGLLTRRASACART